MLPENSQTSRDIARKFAIWVLRYPFKNLLYGLLFFSHPTQLFSAITTRNFLIAFPFFIFLFSLHFHSNLKLIFPKKKFGFHAGIYKYQKYVTKMRERSRKKHMKRLKMSLKRISIPFFTQLIFEHFAHFLSGNVKRKMCEFFAMQLPQKNRKRGGSGAL